LRARVHHHYSRARPSSQGPPRDQLLWSSTEQHLQTTALRPMHEYQVHGDQRVSTKNVVTSAVDEEILCPAMREHESAKQPEHHTAANLAIRASPLQSQRPHTEIASHRRRCASHRRRNASLTTVPRRHPWEPSSSAILLHPPPSSSSTIILTAELLAHP